MKPRTKWQSLHKASRNGPIRTCYNDSTSYFVLHGAERNEEREMHVAMSGESLYAAFEAQAGPPCASALFVVVFRSGHSTPHSHPRYLNPSNTIRRMPGAPPQLPSIEEEDGTSFAALLCWCGRKLGSWPEKKARSWSAAARAGEGEGRLTECLKQSMQGGAAAVGLERGRYCPRSAGRDAGGLCVPATAALQDEKTNN